jgi:hypothetical protein
MGRSISNRASGFGPAHRAGDIHQGRRPGRARYIRQDGAADARPCDRGSNKTSPPAEIFHRMVCRRGHRPNIGRCRSCLWPEPEQSCHRRATIDTDAPGTRHAATISRLSASGHTLCRRFARKLVSIISVVDTFHPQVTILGALPRPPKSRRRPLPEGYSLWAAGDDCIPDVLLIASLPAASRHSAPLPAAVRPWSDRTIHDPHVRHAVRLERHRTPLHQDQPSLDEWSGREDEPHNQGSDSSVIPLRQSPRAHAPQRLRRRLQCRPNAPEPHTL